METVIGIKFNDFVIIATDMTAAHSIMVMKDGKTLIIIGTSIITTFYLNKTVKTYRRGQNVQYH